VVAGRPQLLELFTLAGLLGWRSVWTKARKSSIHIVSGHARLKLKQNEKRMNNNSMNAKFNFVLNARLIALCVVIFSVRLSAPAGQIVLEDNLVSMAFDSDSGALTRMESKPKHWVIERRPELGVSFRLFAPLPNRRYNPVLGQRQHAVEVKKLSDNQVKLQWKDLISENGGVLPMTLTAEVTLTNGVMTFGATLENNSSLAVETIDYPYFGDFNPPRRDSSLEARTLKEGKADELQSNEVYPHFRNEKGYWGVSYPTKTLEAQQSLFCLLQAPDEGLYIEMDNPMAVYRLQYTFEQHPGVISAVSSLVPQQDEFSGFPVHLELRLCHFVFAKPHSTTTLVPIVLRCYNGDWHNGLALYQPRRPTLSH
jgi:hypothetical protein